MSEIKDVPIVEINADNFLDLWPCLVIAIKSSSFIAIDSELSGLGNRKLLMSKCIDERYKSICEVAKTRAIISLGISCYKINQSNTEHKSSDYTVQTFNLLILCLDDYIVESNSIKFLIDHGFDFNAQYKYGIPYCRGNDKIDSSSSSTSIRHLFEEIVKAAKPLIVHNGLVDLIFIYENLYADLPTKLATFLADLSLMFPNAIYDTKYLADFELRSDASFLEYIFRKCQRQNCIRSKLQKKYCKILFLNYDKNQPVVMLPFSLDSQPCLHDIGKTNICENFANHGWCTDGITCSNSHDVDLILDGIGKSKKKNKKCQKNSDALNNQQTYTSFDKDNLTDNIKIKTEVKNLDLFHNNSQNYNHDNSLNKDILMDSNVKEDFRCKCNFSTNGHQIHSLDCTNITKNIFQSGNINLKESETMSNGGDIRTVCADDADAINEETNGMDGSASEDTKHRSNGHRAGLDAFMTGYIFATFLVKKKCFSEESISGEFLEEFGNKVYLSGKDFPLQIVQSSYAKPSRNYFEKTKRLNNQKIN